MASIEKVAVVGAGVMGSAIASQIANCETQVLLYDIVDPNSQDRSNIAKSALEKILNNPLKPLMSRQYIKFITPLNLEDHLEQLKDVDWVIEAVSEKIDIKRNVYSKIQPFLKKDAILSSNTSTIPLSELTKTLNDELSEHFLITHFFNPPRYLTLLELVAGPKTKSEVTIRIQEFLEVKLGRNIVNCKDTPGFIANRIGCFWLELALRKALIENVPVNVADKIISAELGIPKTGIFGLWDLIGIDLMPMISKSMTDHLTPGDAYYDLVKEPVKLIDLMISKNYLGKKAKQGFYKSSTDSKDNKIEYVIDLKNGEYIEPVAFEMPKFKNLREMLEFPGNIGRFAFKVMAYTLNYAASMIPEAAFTIYDIDTAMKSGYGWKYGPFEIIDQLSDTNQSGAEWLRIKLEIENITPAPILKKIGNQRFYKQNNNKTEFFFNETYLPIKSSKEHITLEHFKNHPPILENKAAKLWDIEKNVVCLELTNKMHVLDEDCFNLIIEAVKTINTNSNYIGMVIANDDENFCAGANVNIFLELADKKEYGKIKNLIELGQKAMLAIKYSKKPIVCAVSGIAFGGGCELILHSHGSVVYSNSKIGLVETSIGIIPAWGGTKEMIFRPFTTTSTRPINEAISNFHLIRKAQNSDSAIEAKEMGFLGNISSKIIMNRKRLLFEAREFVQELARKPKNTTPSIINFDVSSLKQMLKSSLQNEQLMPHEQKISDLLIKLFTNNGNSSIKEENLLELEKEAFLELLSAKEAIERMISVIKYKRVIRN